MDHALRVELGWTLVETSRIERCRHCSEVCWNFRVLVELLVLRHSGANRKSSKAVVLENTKSDVGFKKVG